MGLFERKKEDETRLSAGMNKEYWWVCPECGLINETTASTSRTAKCTNCKYEPGFKEFWH